MECFILAVVIFGAVGLIYSSMQSSSNHTYPRRLLDWVYIAIFIFNMLIRLVVYIAHDDICHGAGGLPYARFCAQQWWYLLILIPDVLIPYLALKRPFMKKLGWAYPLPILALYLVYVLTSWKIYDLPFFYEKVGSELR